MLLVNTADHAKLSAMVASGEASYVCSSTEMKGTKSKFVYIPFHTYSKCTATVSQLFKLQV